MKTIDRRSFLLGPFKYFKAAEEDTEEDAEEPAIPSRAPMHATFREPFSIGRIADFPVGIEKHLQSGAIIVESLPEGLRARSTQNVECYYAIGIDRAGEVKLNLEESWPSNRVFSILTCESANL